MKIQQKITDKLEQQFSPSYLQVINESSNHNVPAGSESHFKVVIATQEFQGKRLLQRHRAINACLSEELANDIHALALHTYTPEEWQETQQAPSSPDCLGGSKFDR